MNKLSLIATSVVILLVALVSERLKAQSTCGYNCGKNLIFNGDFELGNIGFMAAGYNINDEPSNEFGAYYGNWAVLKSSVPHSGKDYNKSVWTTAADHTSGAGNFFLYDQPGLSGNNHCWLQRVKTTVGKTYNFSAWISNICPTMNLPHISLESHGLVNTDRLVINTTLVTYDANIPWVQICGSFVASAEETTLLVVSGYSLDGILGADLAIDDIELFESVLSGGNTTSSISPAVCNSYQVPSNTRILTQSGHYSDTISNAMGCDSIISIDLTILEPTESVINVTACQSYTVPSGNNSYSISGTYTDVIQNEAGCDSTITINLTMGNSVSTLFESACESYVSPAGNTYSTTGTYHEVILNSVGCDSLITINLTLKNNSKAVINAFGCNQYVSAGGVIYNESGTYEEVLGNASGCDSVITINLTINTQTEGSITETACNSYTSPSGLVFTGTGVYKDTIPNTAGCDSVITITLTINSQTEASITETACNSYTSPSGIEYTSTGVYKDTIPNVLGCDSVITINLTINSVDATVTNLSNTLTANQAGAQYQWLDCDQAFSPIPNETNQNYTPIANGSYAVDVTYNNCTERSACQAVTNIGIGEVIISNNLSVYPNPVTDWLTIRAENSDINAQLFIADNLGRVVLEGKLSNTLTHLNLQQLAPGVYNLLVKQNDVTPVLMQGLIVK